MTDIVLGVAGLSAVLTLILLRLARWRRWFDLPGERSLHEVPTPRLGGIAIVTATLVGVWMTTEPTQAPLSSVLAVIVGGTIVALVGVVDDIWSTSPAVKFGGQALAVIALFLLWPPPGLSLIWIVVGGLFVLAYTNAFNFMDGSDGLAAGVAVISSAGLVWLGWHASESGVAAVSTMVMASTAGFLVWNYPKASIFMGDAGSQFLGFVLAAQGVVLVAVGVDPLVVLLVYVPFLFDTGFTLWRRLRASEVIWQAHRTHVYQRLVGRGWSHEKVAWSYYAWTAGAVLVAPIGVDMGLWAVAMLFGVVTVPGIGLAFLAYTSKAE
jgi:UDP-N-acetylmuramyl pentapeptide phosphotransferase/UDP-N-acetylglucosamine-1-phosphate transferase